MPTLGEDIIAESCKGKPYIASSLGPNQFYIATEIKKNKIIGQVYNLKNLEYQFSAPFKLPRHNEDRRVISISEDQLKQAQLKQKQKQSFRRNWFPVRDMEEKRVNSIKQFKLARARGF